MTTVYVSKGAFSFPIKKGGGWVKVVEGIDPQATNGFGVLGQFVRFNSKKGAAMSSGAILLACDKQADSNQNEYRVYTVADDSSLTQAGHFTGRGWFEALRDIMVNKLCGYGRSRTANDKQGTTRIYPARKTNPTAPSPSVTNKEADAMRKRIAELEAEVERLSNITRPAMLALREVIGEEKWTANTDDEPKWYAAILDAYETLFSYRTQPSE